MTNSFRVNSPAVVWEIIDGEAVLANLKSGCYFSTTGIGSTLWTWIDQGLSREQMVAALAARHEDDSLVIASAVETFLDELLAHDLIRRQRVEPPGRNPPPTPLVPELLTIEGGSFIPPSLEVFDDMTDVLLLDPIHEVDDVAGWPTPKGLETLPQAPNQDLSTDADRVSFSQ